MRSGPNPKNTSIVMKNHPNGVRKATPGDSTKKDRKPALGTPAQKRTAAADDPANTKHPEPDSDQRATGAVVPKKDTRPIPPAALGQNKNQD